MVSGFYTRENGTHGKIKGKACTFDMRVEIEQVLSGPWLMRILFKENMVQTLRSGVGKGRRGPKNVRRRRGTSQKIDNRETTISISRNYPRSEKNRAQAAQKALVAVFKKNTVCGANKGRNTKPGMKKQGRLGRGFRSRGRARSHSPRRGRGITGGRVSQMTLEGVAV